jgi:predicted peroxiredoxin
MTRIRITLFVRATLLVGAVIALSGCNAPASSSAGATAPTGATTVLLSVTSDASQNPQSVDMAMRFAGFALDEGRRVVIFFNVKGVTIPTAGLPDDFAFGEGTPIKQQVTALIERGADVHVCPICMQALDVEKSDLIDGAKVTTRSSLFANIGPSTVVFTY